MWSLGYGQSVARGMWILRKPIWRQPKERWPRSSDVPSQMIGCILYWFPTHVWKTAMNLYDLTKCLARSSPNLIHRRFLRYVNDPYRKWINGSKKALINLPALFGPFFPWREKDFSKSNEGHLISVFGRGNSTRFPALLRKDPSLRGALQVAFLYEKWFMNLLKCVFLLAHSNRNSS